MEQGELMHFDAQGSWTIKPFFFMGAQNRCLRTNTKVETHHTGLIRENECESLGPKGHKCTYDGNNEAKQEYMLNETAMVRFHSHGSSEKKQPKKKN